MHKHIRRRQRRRRSAAETRESNDSDGDDANSSGDGATATATAGVASVTGGWVVCVGECGCLFVWEPIIRVIALFWFVLINIT
jgi:hypothetical protein